MNRLFKPLVLLPLAAALAVTPAVLAASCGTTFSVVPQNASILLNTREASLTGASWKEIVNKYNETASVKATLAYTETVPNAAAGLALAINANDNWNYNLLYGYPSAIGGIAARNLVLPLADSNAEEKRLRNLFDERVTRNNDNIFGLPKDGFSVLPLAKSSELLAINKPLAAHLLSVAKANNYLASTNTTSIDALISGQQAIADGDFAYLQSDASPWKPKATITRGEQQFDDSIFTDAKALLDFSVTVRDLFTINAVNDVKNPSVVVEPKDFAVLGIDSLTNFIYSKTFSLAGGNYDNFLFGRGTNAAATTFDYRFANDANSVARRNFNTVYDALARGVNSSAVYFKQNSTSGSAVFSSAKLASNHTLAFAIGSTAGYNYNFQSANFATDKTRFLERDELQIAASPGRWDKTTPVSVGTLQGPSLMALQGNAQGNAEARKFVQWLMTEKFNWPAFSWRTPAVSLPATTEPITAGERFGQMGGYIWAEKDALTRASKDTLYYSEAQQLALGALESSKNDAANYTMLEDPVDFYSGILRETMESEVAEQYKQHYETGANAWSSEQIVAKLRQRLS